MDGKESMRMVWKEIHIVQSCRVVSCSGELGL